MQSTKSSIENPKSPTKDQKAPIQNPKYPIQNPKSPIQNPKYPMENPRSKNILGRPRWRIKKVEISKIFSWAASTQN